MVTTDANNVTDPSWNCFVDEIKISNPEPTFKFPEDNWLLCEQPEISSGSHILTIQVQSKGRAFCFDCLVCTPAPGEGSIFGLQNGLAPAQTGFFGLGVGF
jgi:hypothetical protein